MISHIRSVTGLLPQSVRYNLRKLMFSGSTGVCSLCGNGVKYWASHGGGPEVVARRDVVGGKLREDDRCPICHGADRTRLISLWLEQFGNIGKDNLKILHFAPEYGLYQWMMRMGKVEYTGSDLDKSRYRHIHNMIDADLTNLPLEDNSFDIVICSHVLEHIPDDTAAMKSIFKVLKPGGAALLLVPEALDGGEANEDPQVTTSQGRREHFGQWDHVRLYTPELFDERLRSVGFDIEKFNGYKNFPEQATKLHLNPKENLRVAKKPS